jgi:hypothetical protein
VPIIEGHGRGFRSSTSTYSFASQGGVVGSIPLVGDAGIPSGATVVGGYLEVVTPPTSGGAATLAVQVEGAGDIVAAAVVTGAPWSTTGRKSIVPAFTGATTVRTTAARQVTAVVAVAALTAGAFNVVLFWQAP